MTLLSYRKMGCGQSIRKKSKHKVNSHTDENTYDNQSYGTAPSSGTVLSKQSATAQSSRSVDQDDGSNSNKLSTRPPGSTNTPAISTLNKLRTGGSTGAHINGDISRAECQAEDKDEFQEKTRKDSGSGRFGLVAQSKMSASQLDFFRILDEKIEQGKDYCINGDTT